MAIIKRTVTLLGGYKGKTVQLAGANFKNGVAKLEGDAVEVEKVLHYLRRCYNIDVAEENSHGIPSEPEPNKDPALSGDSETSTKPDKDDTSEVQADAGTDDDGQDGRRVEANGGDGASVEVDSRMVRALHKLDPEDDSQWNKNGKPSMYAVEQFYGSAGVNRKDVDAAIPDFDRDAARKLRAEG